MTPDEFVAALASLDLKQTGPKGASTFFEVNDTTVRRWISGASEIPLAYAMVLRIMIKHGWKPENVKAKYGSN